MFIPQHALDLCTETKKVTGLRISGLKNNAEKKPVKMHNFSPVWQSFSIYSLPPMAAGQQPCAPLALARAGTRPSGC